MTQKVLALRVNPFERAIKVQTHEISMYVARFKRATFFYIIRHTIVYVCGVIFDWDRPPVNPGGGDKDTQPSSISAEAVMVLKVLV